jgi:large subunit ribosomal protein L11
MPIPCVITAYQDSTFSYITKTPPASYFLKKAASIDKASKEPGREIVSKVTMKQVREIAEKKMTDLNTKDIDAACRMIAGSARSMGIEVQE